MAGYLIQLLNAATAEITNNVLRESVVSSGFTRTEWMFFPGHVNVGEVRMALNEVGSTKMPAFRITIVGMTN